MIDARAVEMVLSWMCSFNVVQNGKKKKKDGSKCLYSGLIDVQLYDGNFDFDM